MEQVMELFHCNSISTILSQMPSNEIESNHYTVAHLLCFLSVQIDGDDEPELCLFYHDEVSLLRELMAETQKIS